MWKSAKPLQSNRIPPLMHTVTERANPPTQRFPQRWAIWLLIALILLAFGRICTHGFVHWDDDLTIWHNSAFNPPSWKVLRFWVMPYMGLYIPVTYSIWGGLAYLSSLGATTATPNPWIFHTASVLIHVASALIVFAILKRLLKNDLAAFFGAGVFALHPIQVEAVAWASGMKDLLCGLFSLLAIWQYIRAVQNSHLRQDRQERQDAKELRMGEWAKQRDRELDSCRPLSHSPFRPVDSLSWRPWHLGALGANRSAQCAYATGLILFVLAMLSKPTAMVVPLMLLIVDHCLLDRSWKDYFKSLWPWFVLIIPIAISSRLVQTTTGTPLTPLWTRPFVYTDAIAFYMLKFIWPIHLSLDYARSPVYAMQQGWIYWTWIFPAIAAVLIIYFRKHKWLVAGALLFLTGWLPTSGLTGFLFQYYSTVADHYLYLPMFGIAIIAAYAIASYEQVEPGRPRPVLKLIYILILAFCTITSFIQAGYWRNEKSLYEHILTITPRSYIAHINLAMVLRNEGKFDQPEKLLIEATRQNPNYYQAWETLADLFSQRDQMDRAIEAEKHAIADCQLLGAPQYDRVREFDIYGQLLMKANRKKEAITQFQNALNLDPNYKFAQQHLRDTENSPAATMPDQAGM